MSRSVVSVSGCPFCGVEVMDYAEEPRITSRMLMRAECTCRAGHCFVAVWRPVREAVIAARIAESLERRGLRDTTEWHVASTAARGLARKRRRPK